MLNKQSSDILVLVKMKPIEAKTISSGRLSKDLRFKTFQSLLGT